MTAVLAEGLSAPDDVADYTDWARGHDAAPGDIVAQRSAGARLGAVARFLIVIDATVGSEREAAALVDRSVSSLAAQSWSTWRGVAIVAGPPTPSSDPRVESTTVHPADPGHQISQVINSSLDLDFVIFLRAGDELAPDCLYHVALAARRDPLVDLIHWDDDLVDGDGRRSAPRFRPSWSPDMLLSTNPLDRSFALRRARFASAGDLTGVVDDAAVWDLLLRLDLDSDRVARLPRVLAHVRTRATWRCDPHAKAVRRAALRRDPGATVTTGPHGPVVRWSIPDPAPLVSIVLCTRHNRPMLLRSLGTLPTTDYPNFEVVVVDNGMRDDSDISWYQETFPTLDLRIERWTQQPFNYSAVNNHGARVARGDILVFLNDDTEVIDPGWLRELVSWALRPGVATVGLQLRRDDGSIQHAGAILGLGGFADHVFEGMRPGSDSLLGPTDVLRNVLAATGACVAMQRTIFDNLGGFDERFILCGSDVAIGLDAHRRGMRNVVSHVHPVAHLESATRGTAVPEQDFYVSYWRYQPHLFGGDPYFSPNLSLTSRVPRLRLPDEPTVRQMIAGPLGRSFDIFRQRSEAGETVALADVCRARESDRRAVVARHKGVVGRQPVKSLTWFFPEIDSPFYGGINTALRIADQLARDHGVDNRFAVWGRGPENFTRSALAAAFPRLAGSEISHYDGRIEHLDLPPSDAAIATLWTTAYKVAQWDGAARSFYLIQDFEPAFYPAGTLYALTEHTYRLGLYGLCNTRHLLDIYRDEYSGQGFSFQPAVDRSVFHPEGRLKRPPNEPVTVFVYARPGHWRNCWEMATLALRELKARLGDRIRIVTAGSWAHDDDPAEQAAMRHLGLLEYRQTGALYRTCDVGIALTVSKHPSYLPLELSACGVAVVAFDNPHGSWLLEDGVNCLLADQTVDGLIDAVERLVVDPGLRERIAAAGVSRIDERHSDWPATLGGIFDFLSDPEGQG